MEYLVRPIWELRWLSFTQVEPAGLSKMMDGAEQAGKKVVRFASGRGKVTASNITFYTIEKLRSGRRSTGSSCVDVYGSGTQLNGTTRLNSLEEVVASTEEAVEKYSLSTMCSPTIRKTREQKPRAKWIGKTSWQDYQRGTKP